MSDKKSSQRGLGRGLSALMSDVAETSPRGEDDLPQAEKMVPVERITPNPEQPRRSFGEQQLADLAASIREKGIIQPLIVRPRADSTFEIVAGERRWRAAQMAQLHEIPVIVRDLDDTEVLEVAIIENIQRADLNPVEEASGYSQLMTRFGHTQEKLAEVLGKSRSHIANSVRLLNLPEEVQALLRDGRLSAGHARALITAEDPLTLAQQIIRKDLSVRETEKLVKKSANAAEPAARRRTAPAKDADTRVLEDDLSASLGMKVTVEHAADGETGQLRISYASLDDLDTLCRLLSGPRT